jgi:hypothetical protein
MNHSVRGGIALLAALAALSVTACTDPAATAKAEADAAAAAEKSKAADKLKRQLAHDVECLSAIRWQSAALGSVGGADVYTKHFQDDLLAKLGTELISSEAPKPSLSRATLEDYLNWSYHDDVTNKFTAGKDGDGDGKVSPREKTYAGFNTVARCVQEVAEQGKGPLAKDDKVIRMVKVQALTGKLKDKGA